MKKFVASITLFYDYMPDMLQYFQSTCPSCFVRFSIQNVQKSAKNENLHCAISNLEIFTHFIKDLTIQAA